KVEPFACIKESGSLHVTKHPDGLHFGLHPRDLEVCVMFFKGILSGKVKYPKTVVPPQKTVAALQLLAPNHIRMPFDGSAEIIYSFLEGQHILIDEHPQLQKIGGEVARLC